MVFCGPETSLDNDVRSRHHAARARRSESAATGRLREARDNQLIGRARVALRPNSAPVRATGCSVARVAQRRVIDGAAIGELRCARLETTLERWPPFGSSPLSRARSANTARESRCRPMCARSCTSARAVASVSDRCRAIVVSSVRSAIRRARRNKTAPFPLLRGRSDSEQCPRAGISLVAQCESEMTFVCSAQQIIRSEMLPETVGHACRLSCYPAGRDPETRAVMSA